MKKQGRVIEVLRRTYYKTRWAYEGMSNWVSADGRRVIGYSTLAPLYDGDDDSFVTIYRWGHGDLEKGREVACLVGHRVPHSSETGRAS